MNSLRLFWAELLLVLKKPKISIPIIAVIFIPILYAGLFLWAFWNPYNSTDKLPVAVVNLDQGATMNGKALHIGDDFVKSLKSDHNFNWKFVSQKDAAWGINHKKYYMTVTIPSDFSKKATTVLDKQPQKLSLYYQVNDNYNFIAAKMGDTGAKTLRTKISDELTKKYTTTMFNNLNDLSSGLKKASNGASDLTSGSEKIVTNTKSLQSHLNSLASSTADLNKGVGQLDSGASDLNNGAQDLKNGIDQFYQAMQGKTSSVNNLASGATSLNSGLNTLNSKMNSLVSGQKQVQQGADQLKSGTKALASGTNDLNSNTQSLAQASSKLSDGASTLSQGMNQLAKQSSSVQSSLRDTANAVGQLSQGMQDYLNAHPELRNDPAFMKLVGMSKQISTSVAAGNEQAKPFFQGVAHSAAGASALSQNTNDFTNQMNKLATGTSNLNNQVGTLQTGASQLDNGTSQVSTGINATKNAINQLASGASQLQTGTNQLKTGWPTILSSVKSLQSGASSVQDGSQSLKTGLDQLSSNTGALNQGADQLNSGAKKLTSGMIDLHNGNQSLATQLKDAYNKTTASTRKAPNENMFAKPVVLKNAHPSPIKNYGMGLTPYFLSLGLFVGTLLMTIVYSLRDSVVRPKSGLSWALGKYGMLALFGILQSVIADSIILFGLHLKVDNHLLFYLFSILCSLTFMAIIQFFVSAFSNPGRFIVVIILILQLTTSGGTYPIELIPARMQAISPYLPMTYTVDAFRQIIAGKGLSMITSDIYHLLGFMFAMIILSIVFFMFYHTRKYKKDISQATDAVASEM